MGDSPATCPHIVDLDRPWVGLPSFDESTADYFFGRAAEIDELETRIRIARLTILFSRSGLGKTSLLRAGLIPQLKRPRESAPADAGFQPFYHRISYDAKKPHHTPSRQLADLLTKNWELPVDLPADPQDAAAQLWFWAHDRARAEDPQPLLILDQFEEIFTLGAKLPGFAEDLQMALQILHSGTQPPAVRAALLRDDAFLDRFSPTHRRTRILIVLREDWVHALDRWRSAIPELLHNRMELRELCGPAAYDAIYCPGALILEFQRAQERLNGQPTEPAPLVLPETAERIVCFVAGEEEGTPLAEIKAVPSILSLLCRELNEERFHSPLGSAEYPAPTIRFTGSGTSVEAILNRFYETAVGDQLEALRRFIEDKLVSEAGYRLQHDEESYLKNVVRPEGLAGYFQTAEAARIALDVLIARRLVVRLEDGGRTRYELTHDLLCSPARKSKATKEEQERTAQLAVEKRRAVRARRREEKKREEKEAVARQLTQAAKARSAALAEAERQAKEATVARNLAVRQGARARGFAALAFLVAVALIFTMVRLEKERTRKQRQQEALEAQQKVAEQQQAAAKSQQQKAENLLRTVTTIGPLTLRLTAESIKETEEDLQVFEEARKMASKNLDDELNKEEKGKLGTVEVQDKASQFAASFSDARDNLDALEKLTPFLDEALVLSSEDERFKDFASNFAGEVSQQHEQFSELRERQLAAQVQTKAAIDKLFANDVVEKIADWRGILAALGANESILKDVDQRLIARQEKLDQLRLAQTVQSPALGIVEWQQDRAVLLPHEGQATGVKFAPKYPAADPLIITVGGDKMARLWDRSGRPLVPAEAVTAHRINDFTFSPRGTQAAVASDDKTVRVLSWNLRSPSLSLDRQRLAISQKEFLRHGTPVLSVVFNPTGELVASSSHNVRVFDSLTLLQRYYSDPALPGNVTSVAFNRTLPSTIVVSSCDDGAVRLHYINKPALKILAPKIGQDARAEFSYDDRYVTATGEDHTAHLWDVATQAEKRRLDHPNRVRHSTFRPAPPNTAWPLVTCCENGEIRYWADAVAGSEAVLPQKHPGPAVSATWSADGRWLATCGGGQVILWDCTGDLPNARLRLTNLPPGTSRAEFSSDALFLAAYGGDTAARLWNIGEFVGTWHTVLSAYDNEPGQLKQFDDEYRDKEKLSLDKRLGSDLYRYSAKGTRGTLHFITLGKITTAAEANRRAQLAKEAGLSDSAYAARDDGWELEQR